MDSTLTGGWGEACYTKKCTKTIMTDVTYTAHSHDYGDNKSLICKNAPIDSWNWLQKATVEDDCRNRFILYHVSQSGTGQPVAIYPFCRQ
jgi:hypothetical protein